MSDNVEGPSHHALNLKQWRKGFGLAAVILSLVVTESNSGTQIVCRRADASGSGATLALGTAWKGAPRTPTGPAWNCTGVRQRPGRFLCVFFSG